MQAKIIERDGTKYLVIEMEMVEKPEPSASGKTLVVASSRGPVTTAAKFENANIVVNATAYFKPAK